MLPKPITIVTSESSSTCFVRPEEFSFSSGHAVTTQTPAQVATLSPSDPLCDLTDDLLGFNREEQVQIVDCGSKLENPL